jgi:hypothetical protein
MYDNSKIKKNSYCFFQSNKKEKTYVGSFTSPSPIFLLIYYYSIIVINLGKVVFLFTKEESQALRVNNLINITGLESTCVKTFHCYNKIPDTI